METKGAVDEVAQPPALRGAKSVDSALERSGRPVSLPALASRRRRFASLGYEAFLIVAVLFVAGFILEPVSHAFPPEIRRGALQVMLAGSAGIYCVLCWMKGHTLAMKAWGISLRCADGRALDGRTAVARYLWALPGLFAAGAGFLWCLVDPDRQFLHDRLAGTRMFDADPSAALVACDHEGARHEK